MNRLAAYARACHPLPATAVTAVITVSGFALGWRGTSLLWLAVAVGVGQLSVGWSNDAVDADQDARVGRTTKPTVAGTVTPRELWAAAAVALVASAALSWWVAGRVGGSFYVLWLAAAWVYNLRLSRTSWSWLPYAVAFGAIPALLTYGLDGTAPAAWMVAVFAIVGVAAHLANALPDIDLDREAGVGGAAVALGARWTARLAWFLLAVGSAVLAVVVGGGSRWLAVGVVAGYAVAWAYAHLVRQRAAMFRGLLAAVALDLVVLLLALS
ncbi:MAG: UbiA family prenyltransferase [Candidatus Nanopelagicales bacterium]